MSFGTHREVGDVKYREAQYNATLTAAAEGFAIGSAATLGAGYLLRQRPLIQRLPLAIRTSLVVSGGVMLGVIYADKAGIAFDNMHYDDKGAKVVRRKETLLEQEWNQLSTFDKGLTYAKENRFKVVIGSWLASMGISWLYIQTQPLSTAQKIVQARVWAQGLTVASMIGMAAITTIPSAGDKYLENQKNEARSSWEQIVDQSQKSDYAGTARAAFASHAQELKDSATKVADDIKNSASKATDELKAKVDSN
ncbi:Replication factor C, subunit RFC4 [Malassezia cuniculi]|uniref:Replication factor C, subunit RFC4 n=1 Tax=Malassezia cuniculi TaxID=948313 RepID=A0AAF0EWR7_9BASI|nr:Replication factor C, subunit RFC4 [Malassezia cuniculi]